MQQQCLGLARVAIELQAARRPDKLKNPKTKDNDGAKKAMGAIGGMARKRNQLSNKAKTGELRPAVVIDGPR